MSQKLKLQLFKKLYFIRRVEERIASKYPEGKMRCPVHLSIGQEAVPAAISQILTKKDFAVSTHRGHAHYLSKGGDLKKMLAEIYGKSTGCSKGKGGSMHLIDLDVNFMGTSAIVGNSIPVGVGLGLSLTLKKNNSISCVFLGEGAVEEGVFYESINFAALRNLPVLFICENNLYSVYSDLSVRQPSKRKIHKMVESIGVKSFSCDGNDVIKCHNLLKSAVQEIRKTSKPCFIEFYTYRWLEHCGPNFDNELNYRERKEFDHWKKRDPLIKIEKELNKNNNLNSIKNKINAEVEKAFDFAEKSPFPREGEAFKGVYAI